jgi:hypothetical protein
VLVTRSTGTARTAGVSAGAARSARVARTTRTTRTTRVTAGTTRTTRVPARTAGATRTARTARTTRTAGPTRSARSAVPRPGVVAQDRQRQIERADLGAGARPAVVVRDHDAQAGDARAVEVGVDDHRREVGASRAQGAAAGEGREPAVAGVVDVHVPTGNPDVRVADPLVRTPVDEDEGVGVRLHRPQPAGDRLRAPGGGRRRRRRGHRSHADGRGGHGDRRSDTPTVVH